MPLNATLHEKLKGKDRLMWTKDAREIFTKLKENLAQATLIAYPDSYTLLFIFCDASPIADR